MGTLASIASISGSDDSDDRAIVKRRERADQGEVHERVVESVERLIGADLEIERLVRCGLLDPEPNREMFAILLTINTIVLLKIA